jgi:hypothetical protein
MAWRAISALSRPRWNIRRMRVANSAIVATSPVEYELTDIARNAIDTHFELPCMRNRVKWLPMTWRAISISPHSKGHLKDKHDLQH